ncbi:Rab GDP dissociation inhibitor alpha [Wickerhamomyces ciferrii]|uniref:Rab GDP dissociation inhibitor n=1 Tax=Wickerhamomyces ciferrii (strain ATCC 14091 / BCRC 22168 / CBS 111 / JCM 3599 / NBRC 0793 / NRRL Y-1031 F-60-10) TaxID=1206466 RepID=K0KRN9_WICCF|nr:Rab GDP dissociation inhibitor alpha [Wickerhamomyces ciferrii]CCH44008.1 Rab GDP dissociation inhibitor alpha [Wickerhamomyces ciferrii]
MANGEFTNILVHTNVTRYVEFKQIDGSFVHRYNKVSKVPATEYEAISSGLIGLFEKRRLKNFLQWVAQYKEDEISTHKGLNLDQDTTDTVYNKFGLEDGTKNFIGHAMGLFDNDSYLQEPARPAIERIILYVQSVARFGKSPYLYPLYGLGELPQGFSRLSAIYGGTFMLGTPINKILYDKEGKVEGLNLQLDGKEETTKSKVIIADPTYFPDKVSKTQKLIRTISIVDQLPLKNGETSGQIIITGKESGRKNDIYIALIGSEHKVSPPGKNVAIVSTIIEGDTAPHLQISSAFKILGIKDFNYTFMGISEIFEPIEDGSKDGVFISKSYDATSHFESVTEDVKDIYFRVMGKPLKLTKLDEGEFNAFA